MRSHLLLLLLAPVWVLAAAQPTFDDMMDAARQQMRRSAKRPPAAQREHVAELPQAQWSVPLALAGTVVLATAVLMALTSLLVELGVGWRRPKRVRIRLVGWQDSLRQRHLPQVNLL